LSTGLPVPALFHGHVHAAQSAVDVLLLQAACTFKSKYPIKYA
jgi:hypothetical protein